jgi:hypothetical protein
MPRPARIRVTFGKPIAASVHARGAGVADGSAYEDYKATVEAVRDAIEAMRTQPR